MIIMPLSQYVAVWLIREAHSVVLQSGNCTKHSQSPLLPVFLRIFRSTGVWIYHKFYGISSVIRRKFMACLFIIPTENKP